jgi:hypothetical protein
MCLKRVSTVLQREGIGYKLFRGKREDGSYIPQWYFFFPGTGGTNRPSKEGAVVNAARFILGSTYKETRRQMITTKDNHYPLGVHLFTSVQKADHEDIRYNYTDAVIVKCKYSHAVAMEEDGSVVVALEVTPIREVR